LQRTFRCHARIKAFRQKKTTFGLVTEVGCLRFDLLFPYRAIPPHTGELLQQQQMQAPILIQWLMGLSHHTVDG
jgi:hypothetical protein